MAEIKGLNKLKTGKSETTAHYDQTRCKFTPLRLAEMVLQQKKPIAGRQAEERQSNHPVAGKNKEYNDRNYIDNLNKKKKNGCCSPFKKHGQQAQQKKGGKHTKTDW